MDRDRRTGGKAGPRQQTTGAICEVCGKSQEQYLEVHVGGEKHIFDSFECAIRGLMQTCPLCGSLLLDAGVQVGNQRYCSYACASLSRAADAGMHGEMVRQEK